MILLIAGLSNLLAGQFALGLCRIGGVVVSVLAGIAIAPAYSKAAVSGGFSFLFILVYAPLAIGEILGRYFAERALQKSGLRMRTLGDSEGPEAPPVGTSEGRGGTA